MLSKEMAAALNQQINQEMMAAYKYFAMAAYCEAKSLDGFSHWLKLQAQEELGHAMKIYTFINDLGHKVVLSEIAKPKSDFSSLTEVFEDAVAGEVELAEDFKTLSSRAMKEGDQITLSFLKWFLDEQVEEIAITSNVLDKIKLVGESGEGIFFLNEEFKKRTLEEGE